MPEEELDRWHREVVEPSAVAMAAVYFGRPPDAPVAIVLLADQTSYEAHARRLLGRREVSPHGHYRPHLRMIVASPAQGPGPLRHELTHALMAFDFADPPAWLAEGLAAMHEDCRVGLDPPAIEGIPRRRMDALQAAIRGGRLRALADFLATGGFGEGPAALSYAHARGLCLYLQSRGVLAEAYRQIRDGHKDDPAGEKTLRGLLDGRGLPEIDADFRRFVLERGPLRDGRDP